jgi:hypothetical protein
MSEITRNNFSAEIISIDDYKSANFFISNKNNVDADVFVEINSKSIGNYRINGNTKLKMNIPVSTRINSLKIRFKPEKIWNKWGQTTQPLSEYYTQIGCTKHSDLEKNPILVFDKENETIIDFEIFD